VCIWNRIRRRAFPRPHPPKTDQDRTPPTRPIACDLRTISIRSPYDLHTIAIRSPYDRHTISSNVIRWHPISTCDAFPTRPTSNPKHPSKCRQVSNGNQLQLWQCNGQDGQNWVLTGALSHGLRAQRRPDALRRPQAPWIGKLLERAQRAQPPPVAPHEHNSSTVPAVGGSAGSPPPAWHQRVAEWYARQSAGVRLPPIRAGSAAQSPHALLNASRPRRSPPRHDAPRERLYGFVHSPAVNTSKS
jgi:hypothetical protein